MLIRIYQLNTHARTQHNVTVSVSILVIGYGV
jgi:hypothetical protein